MNKHWLLFKQIKKRLWEGTHLKNGKKQNMPQVMKTLFINPLCFIFDGNEIRVGRQIRHVSVYQVAKCNGVFFGFTKGFIVTDDEQRTAVITLNA